MSLPIGERVARAMAQASGRDPEGVTAPARGQMGSRRLWELYLPQATAALEATHHAELVEVLAEIALGRGEFNRDPLIHAENTIEDMKRLASDVLAKIGGDA